MHSRKFLTRFFPHHLVFARLNRCPEGDESEGGKTTDEGDGKGGEGAGGKSGKKAGAKKVESSATGVSQEDYDRAVADAEKNRKELATLKKEKSDAATAKLKADNDWKALAEAKEAEAAESKLEAERTRTAFLSEKKYNAVKTAAEKLGLRAEALSDLETLDLAAIVAETTSTGKVNILGADKFAERLKSTKPHWFAEKKTPVVNSGGQRVLDPSDAVTLKDVQDAEKASRKSGDKSDYYRLHKQYQQQRASAGR